MFYKITLVLFVISCIVLIISVLMQSGKSSGMSGSIGGGAEQLFGTQKGRGLDKLFDRVTKVSAIVFMAAAVALIYLSK